MCATNVKFQGSNFYQEVELILYNPSFNSLISMSVNSKKNILESFKNFAPPVYSV